jgi:uncharacterized protein (TIGR02246 family)
MPANAPEAIPALLAAAMNAGDVEAFIELHEPDASSIVPTDGRVASGAAEIREAVEPIFALAPRLDNEVIAKLENDGLALIQTRWALTASERDGQVIELGGHGTIVSRRQPDGSWRIVLENTLSPV